MINKVSSASPVTTNHKYFTVSFNKVYGEISSIHFLFERSADQGTIVNFWFYGKTSVKGSYVPVIGFLAEKEIMKTYIVLSAILSNCFGFVAEAQKSEAELQAVANLLTVQKKEAVAKLVSISGKDSIAFWKVYADYQNDNQKLMMNRIDLYERTANAYNNLNNGVADSLASKYFSNREDQEKLLETYYEKFKTATNSVVAFQFYQAETYLLTQIRANIMSQIPTYGELQKVFKKN